MRQFKLFVFIILVLLLFSTVSVARIYQVELIKETANKKNSYDDFYFVQLTDTHTKHKIFDRYGATTKRLTTVLDKIKSFENPPAFVVITGDLVEWSGGDPTGALNCQTFVSLFHEDNNRLYLDSDLTIPVYTTPGNHDYTFTRNLDNYHKFIDKSHIAEEDRYILTHEDVSLFFMDSGPNYVDNPSDWLEIMGDGLYEDDINWLTEELSNCESSHKIILMHHPAVSDRNEQGEMKDVIARNRLEFIELCETNDVELVLVGHTHSARVYDCDENKYNNLPLNCSDYSTFYVQSDDCKQGVHYRNISIIDNNVWLERSVEIKINVNPVEKIRSCNNFRIIDLLNRFNNLRYT